MVPGKLTNKKGRGGEATPKRNSTKALAVVNAPAGSQESKSKQSVILFHAAGKPESNMTALEKMQLARTGISKQDLEQLKQTTGILSECKYR